MNEVFENGVQMQAGCEDHSEKFPSSVIYVHYGADKYDPELHKKNAAKEWPAGLFKPSGLWASRFLANFGWRDWCESEDYHTDRFDKSFGFRLKEGTRILEVHKDNDIIPYTIHKGIIPTLDSLNKSKLMAEFDGIELFYSENSANLRYNHFYTWDCDSICIWNPDVIVPLPDISYSILESILRRCPA